MKNYLFASSIASIGILFLFLAGLGPFSSDPREKEQVIIQAVKSHLAQVHYEPQEQNDEFSHKVFDLYMKYLDSSKRFLTQSEIDKLTLHRDQIDDQLDLNEIYLFEESNALIEAAIDRAERIFGEVIGYEFDLELKESLQMDPDKKDFAADDAALKDMWRKTLKYDVINKLNKKIVDQDALKVKIADGSASDDEKETEIKSFEEMKKESISEVKENFATWFERMEKVKRSDRFESYVNAILHVYDPHSDFYNPKEKQDFDIKMRGKLEGIGARLSPKGEFTKVVSIVPGGPAWKGKELETDDLITAVKQEGEEAIDVVGMRLDDVVQKIRGKKGTTVVLTVKKPSGEMTEITIVRDVVVTEEGNAKSAIIDLEGVSDKIGYIYLPAFYADFQDENGRSCAKDIAAELEKLKALNVDGIIIDIRNNGGGSLRDVVTMGGLFIEKGPIVQVKPKGRKPRVLKDNDPTIQYSGPLVIMVNEYSVSASEILAAALQDYKRALIVGSPSTFGKGTVQRFFDLDAVRGAADHKPLGQVKMTIQKFFRIDGTSTQLKGVVPDIILPDYYQFIKTGEKDYDFPLEWTEIEPVEHSQNAFVINNYGELRKNSEMRVANDETFQLILENAHRLKANQDDRLYPLNLEEFKGKVKSRDDEAKKFKEVGKNVITGLAAESLKADAEYIQSDSSRIARNSSFLEKLTKDVYLKETVHILDDMIK